MALGFKAGVKFEKLLPQMVLAIQVVEEEFSKYGLDTIITAGSDGKHKEGSKHYVGAALDFRTHHAGGLGNTLAGFIRARLGPAGFDILFESPGKPEEHLHVEYDPK